MLSDNARTMGPLRQKLQYVEVWLHRRHLSDRLARRIRAYYTEIWAAHKGQLTITCACSLLLSYVKGGGGLGVWGTEGSF